MLRQQLQEKGQRDAAPSGAGATKTRTVDRDTADIALKTAAVLQDAEQSRLSIAEIEALAAKRGIAVHHVRLALAAQGQTMAQNVRLPRIYLSGANKAVAVTLPLVYGAFALSVWLRQATEDSLLRSGLFTLLYVYLPFVLSLLFGGYIRYKRVAAVFGVGITVIPWLVMLASFVTLVGWSPLSSGERLLIALSLIAAAVAGTFGAVVRQWFSSKQLPFQATLLKVSDLDR